MIRLKELLKSQQQTRFGTKSESSVSQTDPHQTEIDGLEKTPNQDLPPLTQHIAAYTRLKKCGRQLNTANLPCYQVIYDLSDDQKICACCQGALHLIHKDSSEKVEVIPERYCKVEYTRMKYGCRTCQTIIMSPMTQLAPIIKGMAGSTFFIIIAFKITSIFLITATIATFFGFPASILATQCVANCGQIIFLL